MYTITHLSIVIVTFAKSKSGSEGEKDSGSDSDQVENDEGVDAVNVRFLPPHMKRRSFNICVGHQFGT